MHYLHSNKSRPIFCYFFFSFQCQRGHAELEIYFNKRQKQAWVHSSLCPLEPMNGDRKCVWAGMGQDGEQAW